MFAMNSDFNRAASGAASRARELLLEVNPLADIAPVEDDTWRIERVPQSPANCLDVNDCTVAASGMQAQCLNFFRIFNRAANLFAERSNILLANEGFRMAPHHLLRLVTQQALGRRSFVQNLSVSVQDGDA